MKELLVFMCVVSLVFGMVVVVGCGEKKTTENVEKKAEEVSEGTLPETPDATPPDKPVAMRLQSTSNPSNYILIFDDGIETSIEAWEGTYWATKDKEIYPGRYLWCEGILDIYLSRGDTIVASPVPPSGYCTQWDGEEYVEDEEYVEEKPDNEEKKAEEFKMGKEVSDRFENGPNYLELYVDNTFLLFRHDKVITGTWNRSGYPLLVASDGTPMDAEYTTGFGGVLIDGEKYVNVTSPDVL